MTVNIVLSSKLVETLKYTTTKNLSKRYLGQL